MKTRIISALILLPMVILCIYYGGVYMASFIMLANLIGLYEFDKAYINSLDISENIKNINIVYPIQLIGTIILYTCILYKIENLYLLSISIVVIFMILAYIKRYPKLPIKNVYHAIFGFGYISILIIHLLLIRNYKDIGQWYIWAVLLIAMGSDTFAYFTGKAVGKHKLSPVLSPNKTIEGAIGGIIGASLLMGIFGIFRVLSMGNLQLGKILIIMAIGAVGSIISQCGDLFASAIKRETKIKDFGKAIPGHGGVLDRLDSLLVVGVYVYYVMIFLDEIMKFN